MTININSISTAVNMLLHTSVENIQVATCKETHLQNLKSYKIHDWPCRRDGLNMELDIDCQLEVK